MLKKTPDPRRLMGKPGRYHDNPPKALPPSQSYLGCPVCGTLMGWFEQDHKKVCPTCGQTVKVKT